MDTKIVADVLPAPVLGMSSKVLIVGSGRFGKHIARLFRQKVPLLSVDIHEPDPKYIGDGSFDIRDHDVIILAVPIREYERAIRDIAPRMKRSAVLVDVASVKEHTVRLLRKYAGDRYWVATHPMWGPESYRQTGGDVTGYRLVVTEHTLPKRSFAWLCELIDETGIQMMRMKAAQHDSHLAQTLFVAHLFGQIMSFAGLSRTEIDTVSFGYLMNMVESVCDDIELFLDVFKFNRKRCLDVLRRIENATHQVRLVLEGENV